MKQEDRYLTKVERFIKEEKFIMTHTIENDVTERDLLYSLQVSVEADFLKEMNGVRNFVVHRYDRLDMNIVNEAISRIGELKGIVIKVAEY